MRLRSRTRVALASILALGIAGLVNLFYFAGAIYEYSDTVDGVNLPEVEAIVCLAGGRGRISAAADLWYRYWEMTHAPRVGTLVRLKVPILYLSGMGERASWATLTKLVRPGVLAALKPDHVVIETESANTVENAKWVSRYGREHGWTRVLLVTSRYHMRRARMIFERVMSLSSDGVPAVRAPIGIETLSVYQEPFEPGEWREDYQGIRVTMTEYAKWLYYRSVDAQIR